MVSAITPRYQGKTMSEPIEGKRRGNPNMRAGAPSLNPKGRPPVGESLATAYREKWPPEKIVEHVGKLATGAASEQVRLQALQMIAERTAGKVVTLIDATTRDGAATPERDWSAVPIERRRALLAELRGVPEVDDLAPDPRTDKPSATDDDSSTASPSPIASER